MKDIQRFIVSPDFTVRQALERLNETGEGMLLLVGPDDRLLRTVTDGDIRRMLLSGLSLEDRLGQFPARQPRVVQSGADEKDMLELMNSERINQLPVVDDTGRPVDLMLRREIDRRILLSTPHLGEYEMSFVEEAFRTNWIAPLGPNVDAFERELAAHVGVDHAAAVSSGTAALHLALRLLKIGAGDTVFCSTLTFVASANPVLYVGATPVFIDSEPESWNMSPAALARALEDAKRDGRLPKAVIIVGLYGQSADMEVLCDLCNRYGVPVIEDAAESLGATYKNRSSGALGLIGIYSFNGNKIITTSGGGMLVSNDAALVSRARHLSTQARESAAWYEHTEVGYNYRMSNVLAGIGRGQLKVLEDRVQARRAIFNRYQQGLRHIRAIRWMPEAGFGRSTRWLSVCTIDSAECGYLPSQVIERLTQAGIEARHVWKPMHLQPLFAGCVYYPHDIGRSFSDAAFENGLCLPSGSNMTSDQQDRIIDVLSLVFQDKVRRSGR